MEITDYIQHYVSIRSNVKETHITTQEIYNHFIACGGSKTFNLQQFGTRFGVLIRGHNPAAKKSKLGRWNLKLHDRELPECPLDDSTPDKYLGKQSSSSSSSESERVKKRSSSSSESERAKKRGTDLHESIIVNIENQSTSNKEEEEEMKDKEKQLKEDITSSFSFSTPISWRRKHRLKGVSSSTIDETSNTSTTVVHVIQDIQNAHETPTNTAMEGNIIRPISARRRKSHQLIEESESESEREESLVFVEDYTSLSIEEETKDGTDRDDSDLEINTDLFDSMENIEMQEYSSSWMMIENLLKTKLLDIVPIQIQTLKFTNNEMAKQNEIKTNYGLYYFQVQINDSFYIKPGQCWKIAPIFLSLCEQPALQSLKFNAIIRILDLKNSNGVVYCTARLYLYWMDAISFLPTTMKEFITIAINMQHFTPVDYIDSQQVLTFPLLKNTFLPMYRCTLIPQTNKSLSTKILPRTIFSAFRRGGICRFGLAQANGITTFIPISQVQDWRSNLSCKAYPCMHRSDTEWDCSSTESEESEYLRKLQQLELVITKDTITDVQKKWLLILLRLLSLLPQGTFATYLEEKRKLNDQYFSDEHLLSYIQQTLLMNGAADTASLHAIYSFLSLTLEQQEEWLLNSDEQKDILLSIAKLAPPGGKYTVRHWTQNHSKLKELLKDQSKIREIINSNQLPRYLKGIKGLNIKELDMLNLLLFDKPGFPVDRHILKQVPRIIGETELPSSEQKKKLAIREFILSNIPQPLQRLLHLLMRLNSHWCRPNKPYCNSCVVSSYCMQSGVQVVDIEDI